MIPPNRTRKTWTAMLACLSLCACERQHATPFTLAKGDRVAFVGSGLAERMQLFGYFETLLYSRFPDHRLAVHNFGWSGDEVDLAPRPCGFPTLDQSLTEFGADVVFAFFGTNESFAGIDGLDEFEHRLTGFVRRLRGQRYNGKSPPRIVLVSPTACEPVTSNASARNDVLASYVRRIGNISRAEATDFVDLFHPTLTWCQRGLGPLTIDGVHGSARGDWYVSQVLARSLGLVARVCPATPDGNSKAAALRRAIYDKNYTFFQLWRGPNMEYVYGRRRTLAGAEGMPEEREQLREILAQQEARIWRMAKPDPEHVWQEAPPAVPLWVTPPDYRGVFAGVEPAPETAPRPPASRDEPDPIDSFTLPRGYRIELFASETRFPIANPMAIQFDSKGRLWVANTPTWPHPEPGKPPRDSLVVLEDEDGDGHADRHTVFAKNLAMIHGFALDGNGAYIAQAPNLIYAEDTDGDLVADRFEVVLQGFGTEDAEHSINNFRRGPDGALYFLQGTFAHSQVETPFGPRRVKDGAVFRFLPRSHRLDVVGNYALWNAWGQAFDAFGGNIVLDASSQDYFATSMLGSNYHYPKRKTNLHKQLSFAPSGLGPGAGMEIVRSTHFPPEARGRLLVNQLAGGFHGVHWFELEPDGTSYRVAPVEPPLLSSTDPAFRPVAAQFGPDGALYVVDFHSRSIVNTSESKRSPRRDHAHGRIWRITHVDCPLARPFDVETRTIPELLATLVSDDESVRQRVRDELRNRDTKSVLSAVARWIATGHPSERQLLEALWLRCAHDVVDPSLLRRVLAAHAPEVRAAGVRALRFWLDRIDDAAALLEQLVVDDDVRVRLEAVVACGFLATDRARDIALRATQKPMDTGIRHALGETLDYLGQAGVLPETPEGVAFVLSRMPNEQLARLPHSEAVCTELLRRPGVTARLRTRAATELAAMRGTSRVRELVAAIGQAKPPAQAALCQLLTMAGRERLSLERARLVSLAHRATGAHVRRAAWAALIVADDGIARAWRSATDSDALAELLHAVPLVPSPTLRASFHARIAPLLQGETTPAVRRAAILASAWLPGHERQTFVTLADLVFRGVEAGTAIAALRQVPQRHWPHDVAARLAEHIVKRATAVPARARSTAQFEQLLLLGNELVCLMPAARGRELRTVLESLGVRKVTLRVVPHVLRYDKSEIVVRAGRPVEVRFENPGVMPHNLVIVAPGKLEAVGTAADRLIGASASADGRKFVPSSPDVLYSTPLVAPRNSASITFVAPARPGEYPYLCTVPGHWVRMNGTMHVVEDLDAWLRTHPGRDSQDQPQFVKQWRIEDLAPSLAKLDHPRSIARGRRLFESSCAACHRFGASSIAPDPFAAATQMSARELLEQVLDPSKRINAPYRIWAIERAGKPTLYGRIVTADARRLVIVEDPKKPRERITIPRKQITASTPVPDSMMPSGLLNTMSEAEILDLLAFLRSGTDR